MSRPSGNISLPLCLDMVTVQRTLRATLHLLTDSNYEHNRVIARHQQTRLSYRALDTQSNALAQGLISRGVKKGDRVAVSLGNNIEYAIVRSQRLEWR